MTTLLDTAISHLTDARAAWDRGLYTKCLARIWDATKCCKDAARVATDKAAFS